MTSATKATGANVLGVGDKAPNFTLPISGGKTVSLKDYKGKNLVLYFYPKDDTPGCTKEAQEFTENLEAFASANTDILGVSKDSMKKHDKFREKYCLPFELGADEDCAVCEAYGSWIEKSMYGKKYMGIDRSTFLIDSKGVLRAVWRKVKVTGHVEEVLAAARAL